MLNLVVVVHARFRRHRPSGTTMAVAIGTVTTVLTTTKMARRRARRCARLPGGRSGSMTSAQLNHSARSIRSRSFARGRSYRRPSTLTQSSEDDVQNHETDERREDHVAEMPPPPAPRGHGSTRSLGPPAAAASAGSSARAWGGRVRSVTPPSRAYASSLWTSSSLRFRGDSLTTGLGMVQRTLI